MRRALVLSVLLIIGAVPAPVAGQGHPFADQTFYQWWAQTDADVAAGAAPHSWIWGPGPLTPGQGEPYAESPEGMRLVQYFDKGRMEQNGPMAAPTAGLLARELMTGQVQIGVQEYLARPPAEVVVAGDDGNTTGPTYDVFGSLIARPALDEGRPITQVVDQAGGIGADAALARFRVVTADLVPETQHRLASVFRSYFSGEPLPNTEGQPREIAPFEPWYATTGLPITEAYWSRVPVAGETRDVLVQAFERRVLTYTPANPVGSQVEMGNTGRHYLAWRSMPIAPSTPELACPSVPEPPLAGRDQDRLTVLGSALHTVGGRRVVAGRIRNDGESRSPVEVVVSRWTADGRRLGLSSGFTDRSFWPNGQIAGFRVMLPPDEPLADWRIELQTPGSRPTGGLAGGFSVENLGGVVDGQGVTRVSGQVRYDGMDRFPGLAIVYVYALDTCGGLVTLGLTRAGQRALEPGSVVPFDAVLIGGEGASRVQAVIEARLGITSFVADDALRVYDAGLFPAPRVPIVAASGCCEYVRDYQRPDGTPVRSTFRVTAALPK